MGSLRVNPNPAPELLANLQTVQQEQNQSLAELSSGLALTQPSDNPAAMAAYIENNAALAENDQYTQSSSTLQNQLSVADSSLNTVVQSLSQAISLATEGATSTLGASQRQALAAQVNNLQQQVLEAANQSYQGVYLFGGTDSTTPPYVASGSSPSGVQYVGNTETNSVQLGPGQSITVNQPGSQIFNASGADVFQALDDLATALNANDTAGVQAAGAEVQSAFQAVSTQQTFYGATTQRLQSLDTFLSTEQVQLSQQATTLAGANMPQVATALSQEEVTNQATTSAEAEMLEQPDLFSYLP
ncbi:MAG: flagellar hook-associated protein FlgL [Terriglobales bacterium]